MNPELHKLLLELEYKFDLELDEYFNLQEDERSQITFSLVKYFLPYLISNPNSKIIMIRALKTIITESEQQDEYEKAEIFTRFLKEVKGLIF